MPWGYHMGARGRRAALRMPARAAGGICGGMGVGAGVGFIGNKFANQVLTKYKIS